MSCSITGAPMTVSQSGSTFTGSYGPGELTCRAGSETAGGMVQGVVVNGTISGDAVTFDFDTQDAHHTGTAVAAMEEIATAGSSTRPGGGALAAGRPVVRKCG